MSQATGFPGGDSIRQMLERGDPPAKWVEAIQNFESGGTRPPSNAFLLVFELASLKARDDESREWAEVAARAADIEVKYSSSLNGRERELLRAMSFRVESICRLGPQRGHPALDVETVVNWIRSGLTGTPPRDGTLDLQADTPFPLENYVLLRRIKDRLDQAARLQGAGVLPRDPVIDAWLQMGPSVLGA